MKKIIVSSLLLLVTIVIAANWSLISYAVHLGIGQFKMLSRSRPVSSWLEDKNFPDSLKSKLRLIGDIRQFGIDSLGLKDTENYTRLYNQEGREIMWVVQACEAFDLKPLHWHFPIVGDIPYKGFFEKESALKEVKNWEEKGYDVSLQNPAGWSTLGWFSDPVLSNMLGRSEGDLANLILHEMVHSTIFIKNKTEWNESLATYIGDTSAYLFLNHQFGKNSKAYRRYFFEERDIQKKIIHTMRGARRLDSLYLTFTKNDRPEWKKEKKNALIKQIMECRDTPGLHCLPPLRALPNNTRFMSYRLYHNTVGDFRRECKNSFAGDVKKYIQSWKEKATR